MTDGNDAEDMCEQIGRRRNRSVDTCERDGGVGEAEESRSWERGEEKRRDLGNAGDEKPKLGAGRGVKRGQQVRVGPAAPLRTGYPARKTHLSLPNPSRHGCVFSSHSGTAGEEHRGVAFHSKHRRKTKVLRARSSVRINHRRRTAHGTPGRRVPSCLQRFDDSVVFFILC